MSTSPRPANSTFTLFASPAAAGFTAALPDTPRLRAAERRTTANRLDGIGDRLMFRLAYRNSSAAMNRLVGNYTVSSGGVAGVRWFELRNVTAGPVTVFQESTYQPDTTWRWMGSAAMDKDGDIALGFSASSASIFPQIRYAGPPGDRSAEHPGARARPRCSPAPAARPAPVTAGATTAT